MIGVFVTFNDGSNLDEGAVRKIAYEVRGRGRAPFQYAEIAALVDNARR